jgi:multiple sugar transport system substrate-binding protein
LELISIETVTEIVKIGQQIPIYEEVAESSTFRAAPPNAGLFYDVIDRTRAVAAPTYFSELDRILSRTMDSIITQAETSEDALTKADKELKRAIRKG